MSRYIAPDGTMHDSRPWSVNLVMDTFWGTIEFMKMFFQTLAEPLLTSLRGLQSGSMSSDGRNTSRGSGSRWGGSGGGGPSNGPGSGGRPGGGPNIRTIRDVQRVNFGGCAGGSCGR